MAMLYTLAGAQNEIALVIKSRGLVTVGYPGLQTYAAVSRGYLIMPGALLQTGSNGYAALKFIGSGSIVVLRPRTEVVLNAYSVEKTVTESATMSAGELYLDVIRPRNHIFDLHTPAALISCGETRAFVVLSKSNGGSVFYNLAGTAKIADNNFVTWKEVRSGSAAFVAQNGFVQSFGLSDRAVGQLITIGDNTQQLKPSPPLVHEVTVKAGQNGVVEPEGRFVVLGGVDLDIKATPDPGYTFTGWKVVDGNAYIKDIIAPQTQAFVSSGALLEAHFEEKPSVLEIVKSEYGLTDPAGTVQVQRGAPVNIVAAPKRGYRFAGWKTADNIKIEEVDPFVTSVTLQAGSGRIQPRYVRKKYNLSVDKPEHGVVTPSKKLSVKHGDTTIFTANPAQGYRFIRWELVSGYAAIQNLYTAQTPVVCDSIDAGIGALFSNNAVEVSIIPHERAAVSPAGNFFVVRNSLLSVDAVPLEGYMVSGWTVERGKARVQGTDHALIKCKMPFEIIPVVTQRRYQVSLLGDKNGTVIPQEPKETVHQIPFFIRAVPNQGKHFIRWKLSGGWAEIADIYSDSTQVTLSRGDAVVQAEFAETICTLHVDATHGGYTEPAGKIHNYEGGDVIVQAVPNPKAAFLGWEIVDGKDNVIFSDTLSASEQTVTGKTGNATIKALFSTETVAMTVLTNGLGATTPEGKCYAVKDKWTPIKAVPNEGQKFIQWTTISGTDIQFKDQFGAQTEIFPGTGDLVIKALFQSVSSLMGADSLSSPGKSILKIEYDKTKGSIDKADNLTVDPNVAIIITATPAPGYCLEQWKTIKGTVIFSDRFSATTSVTVSKGGAVISPQFAPKPLHTLEVEFKDYENRTKTITGKYR